MPTKGAIGIIGLGLVGRALAERLSGAGYQIVGYDRDEAARAAFPGSKASAAEVAAVCGTIFLAVFDTADVERVAEEASAKTFIDCTTGDPERIEALAARLQVRGVNYVEARLSGSSEVIRRGEATMFVTGDSAGCEELLAAISTKRHHLGAVGRAARAKLAINLVLGLSRAALAEGMAFAETQGLDRASFLDLVSDTPAASPAALFKGRKMASRDYSVDSRIRQHLKDVDLILAYGRKSGLGLPLSEAHAKLLNEAVAAGDGELDNAAIILRYTRKER